MRDFLLEVQLQTTNKKSSVEKTIGDKRPWSGDKNTQIRRQLKPIKKSCTWDIEQKEDYIQKLGYKKTYHVE